MHSLLFSLRRAFHKSWAMALAITAPFGLTPTRVDILFALCEMAGAMIQDELRDRLGISSSVMSRLLKKLEDWSFVRRVAYADDRRRLVVEITDLGRERLRALFEAHVDDGLVRLRLIQLVTPEGVRGEERCRSIDVLDAWLVRFRRRLRDTGSIRYPADPNTDPAGRDAEVAEDKRELALADWEEWGIVAPEIMDEGQGDGEVEWDDEDGDPLSLPGDGGGGYTR
jgi:DNA-binding MarR family transcriptional regulator